VASLRKISLAFTFVSLATGSCARMSDNSAAVKITSTQGIAYQATVKNVKVLAGQDLFFGELSLEDYRTLMRSPQGTPYMNVLPYFQLGYAQGALRLNEESTMNIGEIKFSETKFLDSDLMSGTYDATITLFSERNGAAVTKDFWVPVRVDKIGLGALIDNNPKCFTNEINELRRAHPTDYQTKAFYYFNPDAAGCSQEIKTNGTLQLIRFDLQPSPENPSELKYPEYAKIWDDQKFTMSLFFTPAEHGQELSDNDPGITAAAIFARKMVQQYGQPVAGAIPADFIAINSPRIAAHPDVNATFRLADGREIEVNLHIRRGDWLQSDPGASAEISQAALNSDYLSYNGHSGYGMNIEKFEESVVPSQGRHLMLFINGCSSFGYLGRGLFKQSNNPAANNKDIDLIANLRATYFHNFGDTNFLLATKIVDRKDTYMDILTAIKQLQGSAYDASVVIRGEENNSFTPRR
jgi:hypothetical protein